MIHQENKRDWIKAFYDSAVEWWGDSWYDGENLQGRLELVQSYGSQTDKRILELGAGIGETAEYLCTHGYSSGEIGPCPRFSRYDRILLLRWSQEPMDRYLGAGPGQEPGPGPIHTLLHSG